ncbi:MAG: glycosyltransferase family 39 protein [Myxococcales bacterium]
MRERRFELLALLCGVAARLPALFVGVEHYGDAPVRIELAERWLAAPHLWRGFTEAFQFGPGHLSLIAATLAAWPSRHWSPKFFSLACGLLSIVLLYRLARRLLGSEAAFAAALILAFSPLHIQASTTAASEAPFCASMLACLLLLSSRHRVLPALLLACAGLIRYDGWLYVPLCAALVYARGRKLADVALFCAIAALPVPLWLWQNHVYAGDALAPIHHINQDHRNLARAALEGLGPFQFRLYSIAYWPWAVLLICTPVAGALALFGSVRAIARRAPGGAIALIGFLPLAYYALRGAVFLDFRPLTRFALMGSVLAAPFAWGALTTLPSRLRRPVLVVGCAALVGTPVSLALASYGRNGGLAEWARPISPVSSVPPGIRQAVRYLRTHATERDIVLVDSAWHYLDIPIAFELDLPESRLVRYRWPDPAGRVARTPPTVAILLYQGVLRDDPLARDASEESDRFGYAGLEFCKLERFVYATVYRRCAEPVIAR